MNKYFFNIEISLDNWIPICFIWAGSGSRSGQIRCFSWIRIRFSNFSGSGSGFRTRIPNQDPRQKWHILYFLVKLCSWNISNFIFIIPRREATLITLSVQSISMLCDCLSLIGTLWQSNKKYIIESVNSIYPSVRKLHFHAPVGGLVSLWIISLKAGKLHCRSPIWAFVYFFYLRPCLVGLLAYYDFGLFLCLALSLYPSIYIYIYI